MSRCVCKSWLAIVDAHRLLWADLLPLLFSGFFMNFHDFYISEFFTPRSDVPSIPGKQDYLPKASSLSWGYIDGHCNGLVLVDSYDDNGDKNRYVLNPATQWLAPLPPCPPSPMEIKGTFKVEYLAYNPTKSTNFEFEVVSVTHFGRMCKPGDTHDHEIEQCEWPPSHKLEYPIPCYGAKIQEHWALRDINYYYDGYNSDHDMEAPMKTKLNGPFKLLKMRNLHGALMMNMDAMVGTWRFLGFIHGKKLSS
ncbi:unnamed protein product [Miscanthus lutarioriparius]|uniref:F-box domain-containing protein n=1 Tax=Miscanthus lutarioriparius TaxID=422564 RepID=A0A811N2B7_9POAL|nr:unnamed protein product [Miscanthus lutarioriparius]